MVLRALGKTGLKVSPISFGAFKIGRNEKTKYEQGYPLPSEDETSRLLNGVLDLGINLIDTAPAYGVSEQRVGRHISTRRREFILSTKVGETFENGKSTYDFSPRAIAESVKRSLTRLKTTSVDFLFIHSDGREVAAETIAAIQSLRKQGKTRFIGLSGKTVESARAALKWADALMIEYHPRDKSHEDIIEKAGEMGVAILVKKPLASGQISAQEAIPFSLKKPQVATLVIGGLNLEHIRANLRIASGV
ncbi:MAG TPA: aldo/keto reductase [Tepidisphaeraceae bacterium]|jgi:aryl-alcohol dehydrogenase-like predicted oxidoreductase|nr:aldo/keto reductase [Tepidisphaeraceae bacterium]